MWDKLSEQLDTVVTAPDRNGNVKVKLLFLPTGTQVSETCKAKDVEKTKKKLLEKLREEAKAAQAKKDGARGSFTGKLAK